MCNLVPSVQCESSTSELPGEAAAGERPGSGTSRDPVRRRAAHFAHLRRTGSASQAPLQLSSPPQAPETTTSATFSERRSRQYSWAQSAATQSRSASRPSSPAFSVRTVRASCRLTQLRCWVVPGRDSSSSASSVRRVPSLHSSVSLRLVYTCLLFLQGLHASVCGSDSPLLSSVAAQRPRHFLASSSQTLPGRQDTAVPAVGTDSVGINPPQTVPVLAPHRRRSAVLLFVGQCLFAGTVITRITVRTALTPFGPFRPRRRRPSAHPSLRSLPLLQGACCLPSAALQSPPSPHFQTASAATLRFAPCPMALSDS